MKSISQRPVYLDYNATTPVDPRAFEAMLPYFTDSFGNASSVSHAYGWEASRAVEVARKQAAKTIHCKPQQIFWTSGATESNNMALTGVIEHCVAKSKNFKKPHLVTSKIEHKAVLDVAKSLETKGLCDVTYLEPDKHGMISTRNVEDALRDETVLVSIMMGNNEIGTINPIAEIGPLVRSRQILFHVDAAQAVGKLAIDVTAMNIDMLSASGHKIYAPKGIGYLYVGERVSIDPILFGGSQEKSLRPGTLNVPAIVGFGVSCEIAENDRAHEAAKLTEMRDAFIDKVLANIPFAKLNGHPKLRLPNNISLSFDGLSPDVMALGLSGLAVSSGSACAGGATSYVLSAIGHDDNLARASIRIGIGRFTKPEDLDIAFEKIMTMTKNHI